MYKFSHFRPGAVHAKIYLNQTHRDTAEINEPTATPLDN